MMKSLRIGTRRSPLALWQAEHIRALLEETFPDLTCSLVRIVTQGDRLLDAQLSRFGGKGLFVNEIENALLKDEVDLAVHSMKDLPWELPSGLVLAAIPPREDPRDVLVTGKTGSRLDLLPPGSCIGTSSLRRSSQLLHHRRDLTTAPVRGNVETRIRRLDEGRFDAIVLALAGLKRLGLDHRASEVLEPEICLPAIGQGALAIEIRQTDEELFRMLQSLHDPSTACVVKAERGFLGTVEGGCQVPIACHGFLARGSLELTGLIASLDGTVCIRKRRKGPPHDAEHLGKRLAEEILADGGQEILEEIREREQRDQGPGAS